MDRDIDVIIGAVLKQLDPNANPQERRQAQQICLDFQKHPQAPVLAFHLIHQRHPPPVRHFGLHILEEYVKNAWDKFTLIEKTSIKNSLFAFLMGGTRDILEEQPFLKEKSTVLVVEIVKREWPQKWPEFIPNLQKLATAGEPQLELALLLIRNLAMEVKEFSDDLSDSRRRQLNQAILNEVNSFFQFFYRTLEQYYIRFKTSIRRQQREEIVAREIAVSCAILTATLRALLAFVEWAPIDSFVTQNLAAALCNLLQEISLRQLAASCLLTIMQRREKDKSEAEKLYFLFDFMDTITNSLKLTSNNKQQDYEFVKTLCKALVAMGMKQLTYFDLQKLPPNYQKYLDLMLEITAHPSLVIACEMVAFWTKLLSINYYKENPAAGPLCRQLLEAFDEKIPKWTRKGDTSNQFDDWRGAFYWQVDFEFSDDFSVFVRTTRHKFTQFIQLIAFIQPVVALEYATQKLQKFIASFTKTCTQETYGKNSIEYILFEACCTQLNAVMLGVKEVVTNQNDSRHFMVLKKTEALLKLIFEFQPTQPLFIVKQLQMFKSFVPYYQNEPAALEFILTRILGFVTFPLPHDPNDKASKECTSVRQQACYTLLHICKAMPELLLPKLDRLVTIVKEMFPNVSDGQKAFLIESLVAVSNAMKVYELQESFLSQLLGNAEEEWNSLLASEPFQNVENFLAFLHLHPIQVQRNSPEELQMAQEQRLTVYKLLQLFVYVWRQTSLPYEVADLVSGGYLNPMDVITISSVSNHSSNCNTVQTFEKTILSMNTAENSTTNEKLKILENEIKTINRLKARHPLTKHSRRIIEGVLRLVQYLHALWTPQVKTRVPDMYQEVFATDAVRVLSLLYPDALSVTSKDESEISRLRTWLDVTRENCYSLVGYILEQESGIAIYSLPSVTNILVKSIFSYLDIMENRHLIELFRCINKLLLCPPQLYNELVPILVHFCLFLLKRLSEHWNNITMNTTVNIPPISTLTAQSINTLQREVVEEIILRRLTKDTFEFMKRFVFGSRSGSPSQQHEPSPLFLFLLKTNINALYPIVTGLVNSLKFPDSVAFPSVLNLCTNLLPILLDIGNKYQFSTTQLTFHAQIVGVEMTMTLLQSLGNKYGQEHCHNVISTLATIYHYLDPSSEGGVESKTQLTPTRPDFRSYFFQAFAKLNISDKFVQDFQQTMAKTATVTSRRNAIRNFLTTVCGLKFGDAPAKTVSEVPEQSEKPTRPPKKDEEKDNTTMDISKLFEKE